MNFLSAEAKYAALDSENADASLDFDAKLLSAAEDDWYGDEPADGDLMSLKPKPAGLGAPDGSRL